MATNQGFTRLKTRRVKRGTQCVLCSFHTIFFSLSTCTHYNKVKEVSFQRICGAASVTWGLLQVFYFINLVYKVYGHHQGNLKLTFDRQPLHSKPVINKKTEISNIRKLTLSLFEMFFFKINLVLLIRIIVEIMRLKDVSGVSETHSCRCNSLQQSFVQYHRVLFQVFSVLVCVRRSIHLHFRFQLFIVCFQWYLLFDINKQ